MRLTLKNIRIRIRYSKRSNFPLSVRLYVVISDMESFSFSVQCIAHLCQFCFIHFIEKKIWMLKRFQPVANYSFIAYLEKSFMYFFSYKKFFLIMNIVQKRAQRMFSRSLTKKRGIILSWNEQMPGTIKSVCLTPFGRGYPAHNCIYPPPPPPLTHLIQVSRPHRGYN